ncbi:MAG: heme ABC exporter ATP-binding protein CcmA [Actinomycetes bacterium]
MTETLTETQAVTRVIPSTLVFDGVAKEFGWTPVLKGVSLSIEEGEYVALMGSNGAGKTTLLRMAAGLSAPTSGSVSIAGVDMRRAGPGLRRRVGFVSHESLLYPDLTGRENLMFHAKLFGLADPERVIEVMSDLLELGPILDRPAGVLSRGNRQRLTLARALLYGPRIVLLDEPFTGLDEESAVRLLAILDQLVASGHTVVMTTHDRLVAESGPRRLVVLADGHVAVDRELPAGQEARDAALVTTEPAPAAPEFTRPKLVLPPSRIKAALVIAAKDLRVDFRTKDVLGSAGLFALAVLITASFTMPPGDKQSGAATGVLWISILFAVILGTGRTMARESADRGIEGLLLSPIPRDSVFIGKVLGSLVLMAAVDIVIIPLFLIMMTADGAGANMLALIGTVALGTVGLVIVSSLFSGIAVGSRLGESMLPLLVMPIVIPLMVGSVELTRQALGSGDGTQMWQWLGIMAGFDLMVAVAAVALFSFVIEE